MNKEEILEIVNNVEHKSNKDLDLCSLTLTNEFNKTKELIIDLTRHLDGITELYDKVNNELGKRKII